jgi:hypothetical protein
MYDARARQSLSQLGNQGIAEKPGISGLEGLHDPRILLLITNDISHRGQAYTNTVRAAVDGMAKRILSIKFQIS